MAAKLETGRSRRHVGLENREYIMEINDNRILSMLVYDYCIIYIYVINYTYTYIYIININKGIYPLGDIPYIYILQASASIAGPIIRWMDRSLPSLKVLPTTQPW